MSFHDAQRDLTQSPSLAIYGALLGGILAS
jgi:hypothetical protein